MSAWMPASRDVVALVGRLELGLAQDVVEERDLPCVVAAAAPLAVLLRSLMTHPSPLCNAELVDELLARLVVREKRRRSSA